MQTELCTICLKPAGYRCPCRLAWYCGEVCQHANWVQHKKVHTLAPPVPAQESPDGRAHSAHAMYAHHCQATATPTEINGAFNALILDLEKRKCDGPVYTCDIYGSSACGTSDRDELLGRCYVKRNMTYEQIITDINIIRNKALQTTHDLCIKIDSGKNGFVLIKNSKTFTQSITEFKQAMSCNSNVAILATNFQYD
jgi:hypothetical protein